MSGGVDSSVAASLLVEQGYDVIGVTMKTFCFSETPAHSKTCCGLDGIMDAKRVAAALDIPHYVFDVEEDFTRDVIDDFVSEYARGRTPNPCVRCNSNTKFKDLMERGRILGCDGIASGHYVRIDHSNVDSPALYRGVDTSKDQSYFLWGLPTEMLPLLHFPLGDLTKQQVREQARALGLVEGVAPFLAQSQAQVVDRPAEVERRRSKAKLSDTEQVCLDALHHAIGKAGKIPADSQNIPGGVKCVSITQWEAEAKAKYPGKPEDKKKAFQRGPKGRQGKGRIGVYQDLVWPIHGDFDD